MEKENVQTSRCYGIDLLRIILMFMVCLLHILVQGGVLAAAADRNSKVFRAVFVLSICAVDGFGIISGYMASGKTQNYTKLVNMWFQVFFYSFVVTLIFRLIGVYSQWDKVDVLKCIVPVSSGKFWYFTAFFILFLLEPVLYHAIDSFSVREARQVFAAVFVVFSVMGSLFDAFRTEWGYSALWLIVLYAIGCLAKKGEILYTKNNVFLISIFAFCSVITWIGYVFFDIDRLRSYISPTIVFNGLVLVILFSRLKLQGKWIRPITPFVFGIYLFQLNQVVFGTVLKDSLAFIAGKPTIPGVIYVFAYAAMLFVLGLIVEFVRSKLANRIGIPMLSRRIVALIEKGLSIAATVLE